MIRVEFAVVGGGPAGAAAAITMARAGREVALFDRARFPRDKICGDGLSAGAMRILEDLGLDPAVVDSWQGTDAIVIRSPSGREVRFGLPEGQGLFAAAAKRTDLDAALVDLARKAGVAVHEASSVVGTASAPGGNSVRLEIEGAGEVRADWVVAADGMWSPVRKHLGLASEGYRGESHAFRQYFTDVGPLAAGELFVAFEPDLLPGYFWSFPLGGGRANVGFGIHRGRRYRVRDMAKVWPDLLARTHLRDVLGPDAQPEGPHRAWPIPSRPGRLVTHGLAGRVLFVGDAAGLADVLTGEGIAQALESGVWAAEAQLGAHGSPVAAARSYGGRVERELVPDDKVASALVRLMRSPAGANFAVRLAGISPWTRRNFARWLFEDEPRGVMLTPARWHRRFLGRPGAFAAGPR